MKFVSFITYFYTSFYSVVFIIFSVKIASCQVHSKQDSVKVHGPGLQPDLIVMPARYFFIEIRNSSHEPSEQDIKVEITGSNSAQRKCGVSINILNRKDGSFIVRYKMYESCFDMAINIKYKGGPVDGFPLKIKGPAHAEDCACPRPMGEWLGDNECATMAESATQIDSDLAPFPDVQFSSFHERVVRKANNSGSMSICNYVIKDNRVYRRCYGQHVGFKTFVDAILLSLTRKMLLPDVELFVNLGDWPLVRHKAGGDGDEPFPLFSWCGSRHTLDIVMPTYDITESSLEAMGRVSLDMLSVQGNSGPAWQRKEPRAFWRGRDSSRERLRLVEIARAHPDLINASLTNFFFFRDQEHLYGPKQPHVSFFDFFNYRYQLNLDGTVAAYRLPYLLAGGSLVLKQHSDYYEHFYHMLEPWRHYLPFKADLSDLVDRLHWARSHDEEARSIAEAGKQFARSHLLPQHIFCYHALLLQKWSRLLREPVSIRPNMELVQPEGSSGRGRGPGSCVCQDNHRRDEL